MRSQTGQTHTSPHTGKQEVKKGKWNPARFLISFTVILFALYFIYIMIWQQISLSDKSRQIEQLQGEIEQANAQAEHLEQELENLNDPEYLEKIAREKLGLVRPNERVFVDANKSEANAAD